MKIQNIQQAQMNKMNKTSFTAVKLDDSVNNFYREIIFNNPQIKNIAKKYNIKISEYKSQLFEDDVITLATKRIKDSKSTFEKVLNFFTPNKKFEIRLFDDKHEWFPQDNPKTLEKKLENLSVKKIEEYIEKEEEYKKMENQKTALKKATSIIK